MLPEGLPERLAELRRRPTLRAAVRAEAEAAATDLAFGTAEEVWIPPVPLNPAFNAPDPRPLQGPSESGSLAGLDVDGRPVLIRRAFGLDGERPAAVLAHPGEETDEWVIHSRVLRHEGARLEVIGFLTHSSVSHVTWIDHDAEGRPVAFATAGVDYNALGKGASLVRCDWEGDRCVRVRELATEGRDLWTATALFGEYDADGLVRVRRAVAPKPVAGAAARAQADELRPDQVWWRRERDGHDPEPLPFDAAVELWIEAVAAAAHAAVTEPAAVLKVRPGFRYDEVPSVTALGQAFCDAAATARDSARDILARTWEPSVDLLDAFDQQGTAAWRALKQRESEALPAPAVRALQERLAALKWPGDALAVVWADDHDPWALARAAYGSARVDALLGVDAPREGIAVTAPPGSREELAALARSAGLPEDVAALASWGLALTEGGTGRSRIGGHPALPQGTPWPMAGGRALTHMASLWLAELPDVEGRDLLPADGVLVVFADLTEEGELWEPTVVGEDDRVVVLRAPADGALHEPEPPADHRDPGDVPALLRERRVAFVPVLTLPEAPKSLTDADRLAYDDLFEALAEVTPGHGDPGHLLLGNPRPVQFDTRQPGEVSVLHLGWDDELGFEILDGGAVTFFGDKDAVSAGRWDDLRVDVQSH